jgi:VWFA-related protein
MKVLPSQRKLSLALAVSFVGLTGGLGAQTPAKPPAPAGQQTPAKPGPAVQPPATGQPPPVIRRSIDLVSQDVIVRDEKGVFLPNLSRDDFEVYEDGVKQDVISFVLTHGGRVMYDAPAAPLPAQEGILLPPPRPTTDASGRIFLIFVDDLHMDFKNTGRIRDLFKRISKELIHDGDLFGIVSSGPSSIAIDMTYDRKRLDEAISKISGSALKPSDITDTPDGAQGPPEVRYRAHVAFSTVNDILKNLESVHNRRKAFIWVSNGYDFDPYAVSRRQAAADRFGGNSNTNANATNPNASGADPSTSDVDPFNTNNNEFAAADLAAELSEVTREANRANATLYTIDPRGLVGMPDLDEKVDATEWMDHIREEQTSLRVLAEQTGGLAVVNSNDFDKALKRIDNETSDYYVLGYYSSNPDPLKRRRSIEIKIRKPGHYDLHYRQSYVLRPRPAPGKSGS